MAKEPENRKNPELEELEELTQQDRISEIRFSEPELHSFNASDIFELKEEDKPRRSLFGKRSRRKATVRIRREIFEDGEEVQEQSVTPEPEEAPEPTVFSSSEDVAPAVDELLQAEQTIQETEEPEAPAQEPAAAEEENEPTIEIARFSDEEIVPEPEAEEAETVVVEETVVQDDAESEGSKPQVTISDFEDEQESGEEDDGSGDEEEDGEDEDDEYEEDDEDSDEYYDEDEEDDQEEEDDEEGEYYEDEPDLFEDKKHFLLSQYPIIEDYLAEQSRDGYHFVRHSGHKYYFTKGDPENYYYSIDYFRDEPSAAQWRKWEQEGWQLVSKAPARKKKEAGWFIFRHPEESGEYPKTIENEEEKYRFFRKYANSCRSTLFLVFICMVCCVITAFLQYEFQGYLWGIAICAILFLICVAVFIQYGRMLKHAKKRARMLQARLRLKEQQRNRMEMESDELDDSETEADLDNDWNELNEED